MLLKYARAPFVLTRDDFAHGSEVEDADLATTVWHDGSLDHKHSSVPSQSSRPLGLHPDSGDKRVPAGPPASDRSFQRTPPASLRPPTPQRVQETLRWAVVSHPSTLRDDIALRRAALDGKAGAGMDPTSRSTLFSAYRMVSAPHVQARDLEGRKVELLGVSDTLHRAAGAGGHAAAFQAASDVLANRGHFVQQSIDNSPFSTRRLLRSKALPWRAAVQVMEDELARLPNGSHATAASRAARASLTAARDAFLFRADTLEDCAGNASGIEDPLKVIGPKLDPVPAVHINAVLERRVTAGLHHSPCNDRGWAQACVQRAMADARAGFQAAGDGGDAAPSTRQLGARFQQAWNQQLNKRVIPSVHHRVVLPFRATPPRDRAGVRTVPMGQMVFDCKQTPAKRMTTALAASYGDDGVEGSNCHDRGQHKHATNVFHSQLLVRKPDHKGDGDCLLSFTRHGALSATAFTRTGLKELTDEQLGRAAMDLRGEVDDDSTRRLIAAAVQAHTRTAVPLRKTAAPFQRPTSVDVAGVGAELRAALTRSRLATFLRACTGGSAHLDALRRAANLRRAQEAVEAAIATLPPQKLLELQRQGDPKSPSERVPQLTLASLSLLTPDAFRACLPGASTHHKDERLMWTDQLAAWRTMSRAPCTVAVPVLGADGQPRRNAQGHLITQPMQIKLNMLPMNFPVNGWGTGDASLFMGVDVTRGPNLEALTHLLGADFREEETGVLRRLNPCRTPWVIGGLVGRALAGMTPQRRRVVEKLARQVGDLYLSGDYRTGSVDPYKMAARVLVLCDMIGLGTLANCKSTKDRTTETEAQARLLRIQIETHGDVPGYDQEADDLEQVQLWALHENGGGRDIQFWTANAAGTKLKGQALLARYGIHHKDGRHAAYVGMSAHVKS